jgi:hypothetical protein
MVLLHHTFGHNVAIATSHNCDCDGILARLQIPAEFRSESPLRTWFQLFGTGMLRLSFCCSASFWMTHFHTSADLNTTPPNCKSGLIRSVRAYLSFLSLHTTKRSWYGGSLSWVELPSSWRKNNQNHKTALPELRVLFRVPTRFRPIVDRNRGQNMQPRSRYTFRWMGFQATCTLRCAVFALKIPCAIEAKSQFACDSKHKSRAVVCIKAILRELTFLTFSLCPHCAVSFI